VTASAIPAWTPHIEVWLLVGALIALGVYAARVIQPKAVAAGEPPITGRQKTWFWVGVAVFYIATDWPMHDIAEQRLYAVHMFQHTLLMVVFPPVMLLSVPTWLARLMIGEGLFKRFVYFWARPAPALLVNLFLTAAMHWAWIVNTSISNAWVHYSVHVLAVTSSLLVWMCICGPIPELRVGPPMKIVVLFLLSIIPAIPAAFLTTAEEVLYQGYNTPVRLWGLSVEYDQQLAGVVMKVIAGFYLWGIIAAIFFKWALSDRGHTSKYRGKLVSSDGTVSSGSSSASSGDSAEDRGAVDVRDAADVHGADGLVEDRQRTPG
jgi:putative membrane protein